MAYKQKSDVSKPNNSPSKPNSIGSKAKSKSTNPNSIAASPPPKSTNPPPPQPPKSPQPYRSAIGHPFLPSHADILEIGKILMANEKAPEWNGLIFQLDMYSDTPEALLAKYLPTIEKMNMYMVWTPRVPMASGFDRVLRSSNGGYWHDDGNQTEIMVEEKLVGYFRVLIFFEGGIAGKEGQVTRWWMREYFTTEGSDSESVICTVVCETDKSKGLVDAFEEASKVLIKNATASRDIKLVTDRSVSKGGKHAPNANRSVPGSDNDGSVDLAPVALNTRRNSIKTTKASGSGIVNSSTTRDGSVVNASDGSVDLAPVTRSKSIMLKATHRMATNGKSTRDAQEAISSAVALTPVPAQAPLLDLNKNSLLNTELASSSTTREVVQSVPRKTRSKLMNQKATRSAKKSTREADEAISPTVPAPVPEEAPLLLLPEEELVKVPQLNRDIASKTGLTAAAMEAMGSEEYYNMR